DSKGRSGCEGGDSFQARSSLSRENSGRRKGSGKMSGQNSRGQGSGARGQRTAALLIASAFLLVLAGCGEDGPKYNGPQTGLPYTPTPQPANPVAEVKTDAGDFQIELFENDAPNTVANFIELADKGFYNGLKFHKVIKGFKIEGGDKAGD